MFKKIGVRDDVIRLLENKKIIKPTEVQEYCIPLVLQGKDVIACAKTGSGKTAAFLIPIIQNLIVDIKPYYCIILTPTRELAHQIGEQAKGLLISQNLAKTIVITGGKDLIKQGADLTSMYHIIIATPGRLAHLIRDNEEREEWSLKRCKYLVLDEADRLLEDNFGEDLKVIFDSLSTKRKTLLFTATLTGPVMDVVKSITETAKANNREVPVVWRASGMTDESKATTVDTLKQYYILSKMQNNEAIMFYIVDKFLQEHPNSLIMIFTNKCKWCQMLHMMLKAFKFQTVMLHSVMTEKEREESLAKFKSSTVRIMVATDLASRGLDIPRVDLVINHNVPINPKSYVHRVGRTARSGRAGTSITMANLFEKESLKTVQEYIGCELEKYPIETCDLQKIEKTWAEIALARRDAERKLDAIKFDEGKAINKIKRAAPNPDNSSEINNTKGLSGSSGRNSKKRKIGGSAKTK